MILVERTGPRALVQDLGRPGWARIGVSPSGAADRGALRLANRLVGNPEAYAGLEVLLGGLVVRSDVLVWVAVTGAPSTLLLDERPTASHATVLLRPGVRLRVQSPATGARSYLAVRGGLEPPPVLGSRSTDTLSGLGPPELRDGDRLAVGRPVGALPATDLVVARAPSAALTVTPGPRRDWFTDDAWTTLLGTDWRVSAEADRVAVRLAGPALARRVHAELPSEGLLRGAVQVPATGQPLVFAADHPVTGGYPVIAVLDEAGSDALAQRRPGDTVRFRS